MAAVCSCPAFVCNMALFCLPVAERGFEEWEVDEAVPVRQMHNYSLGVDFYNHSGCATTSVASDSIVDLHLFLFCCLVP